MEHNASEPTLSLCVWHLARALGHDTTFKVRRVAAQALQAVPDEVLTHVSPSAQSALRDAVTTLRDTSRSDDERLAAGTSTEVKDVLERLPLRDFVSPSRDYPWLVERKLALTGAWYEFFPRSEGAHFDEETQKWVSGTLRTAAERDEAAGHEGPAEPDE